MPLKGEAKKHANRRADWKRRHPGQELPPDLRPAHPRPQTRQTPSVSDPGEKGETARRLIAAHAVLDGKSTSAALRLAGLKDTNDSSRRLVNTLAQRALKLAGGTPDHIAKRHVEALDAEETKFFPQAAYMDPNEGMVIPRENVVAHDIRLRAVDTTYKLLGAYPKDNEPLVPPGGPTVHIEFVSQSVGPAVQQGTVAIDFTKKNGEE